MLCRTVNEHLPTALDATSEPPPLFDGTTRFTLLSLFVNSFFLFVRITVFSMPLFRMFSLFYTIYAKMDLDLFVFFCFFLQRLYISYTCPFAQRVWITRNYKVIFMTFCPLCSHFLIRLVASNFDNKIDPSALMGSYLLFAFLGIVLHSIFMLLNILSCRDYMTILN